MNGQTLMQLEHDDPFATQNLRHFSAFTGHRNSPSLLDILCISWVGSPCIIARLGQCCAHFSHLRQKSQTPNSIGLSGTRGKSVKTLHSRIRGPVSGAIRRPIRESSPSPASMAMGILQAVSFPEGYRPVAQTTNKLCHQVSSKCHLGIAKSGCGFGWLGRG